MLLVAGAAGAQREKEECSLDRGVAILRTRTTPLKIVAEWKILSAHMAEHLSDTLDICLREQQKV